MTAAGRYKICLDILIVQLRRQHPEEQRPNPILGKLFWMAAKAYEPTAIKLGQKPSNYTGLVSSHEIEVSGATLLYLFELAKNGIGSMKSVQEVKNV